MVFLLVWDKDSCTWFPCVVSMHICITTPTGSSLPLPLLLSSPIPMVAQPV
jgi:hypothetical protein